MTMPGAAVLLWTAATVAALHTVVGVDHYVPFVALGRLKNWSLGVTLWVAALCGIAHVAASVVLGGGAIALGVAGAELAAVDSARGALAAWMLVGFGVAYTVWGLWRARHDKSHRHVHADESPRSVTWALFVVFVFGPCETLVPLMTAPGLDRAWSTVAAVVAVFSVVTVAAMLVMVAVLYAGIASARLSFAGRYAHVAAGLALAGSGLAVHLLGV